MRPLRPPLRTATGGLPGSLAFASRVLGAVIALVLVPGSGGWLGGEGTDGPVRVQLSAQQVVTLPPPEGESARGWLGIQLVQRTEPREGESPSPALQPLSDVAFHVARVIPGGPGEAAGLREGDRLVHLDDAPANRETIVRTLRSLRPGDPVRISVERDGRIREFTVEADERPGLLGGRGGTAVVLDSIRARVWSNLDSVRAELERVRSGGGGLEFRAMEDAEGNLILLGRSGIGGERELEEGASERRAIRLREMSDELVQRRVRLDSMMVREHFDLDTLVALFRGREGRRARPVQILAPDRPGAMRWRSTLEDDSVLTLHLRRPPPAAPSPRVEIGPPPDGPPVPVLSGFRVVAGAELAPLNPELAEYFQTERGVLVLSVLDGTPARAAGLEAGDVITHVGEEDVSSIPDFRAALVRGYRSPPVAVRIVRDGTERRLDFPR